MGIEQVVNVNITRETPSIDQAGFGRALILGENLPMPDLIKLYSDLDGVAEDFDPTDEEYKAAAALFSQQRKPIDILIGRRPANVAQVSTVTVESLADQNYVVTINGVPYTYHSPLVAQIDKISGVSSGSPATVTVTINTTEITWAIGSSPNMAEEFEELLGLVNAISEPVTATYVNSGDYSEGILITADVAGVAFTCTISSEGTLAVSHETPNGSGVPADKSEVSDGLMDLINAGSEPVTATLGGSAPNETLIITADVAGIPFTASVTATILSLAATVADQGAASALNDIVSSGVLGNSWYALILCSRANADILAAAAWIEARRKIFIACSSEAGILTSASDDIASLLQARAYARTALIYSSDQANFPEAAWLGVGLVAEPGSMTYSLKTLAGIAYDDLNSLEVAYAKAKGANYYVRYGGVNLTQNGNTAEGEWIDVIVGIDWMHARIGENVFSTLIANDKVPFTDQGIDTVCNPMEQILKQAIDRGILASYTITRPLAASFTAVQKQSRNLTGIKFDGVLAGAIHAVTITGTVHV